MRINVVTSEKKSRDELHFFYHAEAGAFFDKEWTSLFAELKLDDLVAAPEWVAHNGVLYTEKNEKYLSAGETVKVSLAKFLKVAEVKKLSKVVVVLDGPAVDLDQYRNALRGLLAAGYRFKKYFKKQERVLDELSVEIVVAAEKKSQCESILEEELAVGSSLNFARDLVNEPANVLFPEELARRAQAIAQETGIEIEVLDKKALQTQKYNGVLAVGQGSQYEPRMIIMRYIPEQKSERHIALVGKGVTFDTGGVSLKPSKDMHEMKGDMGGAAAVLGAMRAIGLQKPNVRVTAIVPTAENMVGVNAQRPGDIFQHKSGKYIQVDNTDAEGRLILIDALDRAGDEGADTIIDLATLTGACLRALGTALAGLFSNDATLVQEIIETGQATGEAFWELPLVREYRKMLDTPVADIKNIGGVNAGATTAALFLQEFLPENVRWAHMDIAGMFYYEDGWKYYTPGASGFPVWTLYDWVKKQAD